MNSFIKDANRMLELGNEWKQKRAYEIILPIKSKAENLSEKMEVTNVAKSVTTAIGAGSSACVVGALVATVVVPGAPLAVAIIGGYGLLAANVSGVLSATFATYSGVIEKRSVNAMNVIRQADEELLRELLAKLSDAGFSFRIPSLGASSSLDASSLASFISRCGFFSAFFLHNALPVVAGGLILGGVGLPILFDGYTCWSSVRRLFSGENSEAAATFLEFAKLLQKNSEDLLEDLEHTLMEQYMDEKLKEIA